ncbi:hypothetical protein [Synechococcus phage Ssp-JY42]|nr:hypothetical protein [Synechococcus phage Yong-M4-211]
MSRSDPDFSGRSVLWLDQGWQPAYIGFCPSKKAWRREMKRLGVTGQDYPDAPGNTSTYESKGKFCIIVSLNEKAASAEGATDLQVAGLLCHEAVHVWQFVKKNMGVFGDVDWETEAYSVQSIFQNIYGAHLDVQKHRAKGT